MAELSAEVISIGDEMTSGARLDTNAQWLSVQLGQLGIRVVQHTTIGDTLAAGAAAFRAAAEHAEVVVSTGGLGPTADDLTREVLATVSHSPLELDRASLLHIEKLFAGRGRTMPERNAVQAMFPRGSQAIANPFGTAPGIDLEIARPQGGRTRIFALPGVPAEMHQMWHQSVRPRLMELLGPHRRVLQQSVVKCFGIGESEMEQRLGTMIARGRSPEVGITVSQATISLRILADAASPQQCQAMIDAARAEIQTLAGDYMFGEGEAYELQHAVADRLALRGESVATVECGAGAPIAQWMADLERPELFRGGLTLADPPAAARLARALAAGDIDAAAGSNDGTPWLAETVRRSFGCDWLLWVDGYPRLWESGPMAGDEAGELLDDPTRRPTADAATLRHPVRLLVTGPVGPPSTKQLTIGGHPDIIKPRIAKSALHYLWQILR